MKNFIFITSLLTSISAFSGECTQPNELTCNSNSFPATNQEGCGYCHKKIEPVASEDRIDLNVKDYLSCEVETTPAHSGSISYPFARLETSEITGTIFKHNSFSGIGYTTNDFSCMPVLEGILDNTDLNGRVNAIKRVTVYTTPYQDTRGGKITKIETSEKVKIIFDNGISLASRRSSIQKF
jgi:hypothetical protein